MKIKNKKHDAHLDALIRDEDRVHLPRAWFIVRFIVGGVQVALPSFAPAFGVESIS